VVRSSTRTQAACFNPRTRTGCDTTRWTSAPDTTCFNPRTRTGCDITIEWAKQPRQLFQPTHPHGVRPTPVALLLLHSCFNPRTRTGCDLRAHASNSGELRFNPRTRTGCDVERRRWRMGGCRFQPTHPHGVRLTQPFRHYGDLLVSTHAPARGATQVVARDPVSITEFQPTHPHGVRLDGAGFHNSIYRGVSTHAPARGATPRKWASRLPRWFQPTHPHGVRLV